MLPRPEDEPPEARASDEAPEAGRASEAVPEWAGSAPSVGLAAGLKGAPAKSRRNLLFVAGGAGVLVLAVVGIAVFAGGGKKRSVPDQMQAPVRPVEKATRPHSLRLPSSRPLPPQPWNPPKPQPAAEAKPPAPAKDKPAAAEQIAAPAEKPAQPEKPALAPIPAAENPRPAAEKKVAAEKPAPAERPVAQKPAAAPKPAVEKPVADPTIERSGCAEAREEAIASRHARCQACHQQGAGGCRGISARECQAPQRRAGRGHFGLLRCIEAESKGRPEPARAGHGPCPGWQCGPGRAPLQTLPQSFTQRAGPRAHTEENRPAWRSLTIESRPRLAMPNRLRTGSGRNQPSSQIY